MGKLRDAWETLIGKPEKETRQSIIAGSQQQQIIQGDHLSYDLYDDSPSQACIDLIASSIANLDGEFHDGKNGKQFAEIESLIEDPNIRETKQTFWYNVVKDYFDGNAFVHNHGDWLERLNPNLCTLDLVSNTLIYVSPTGTTSGQRNTIPLQNIIHLPSRFGYDGVLGKSVFKTFHKVFERTRNIDNYTTETYDSNGTLTKRLVVDISNSVEQMDEDKLNEFKHDFQNKNYGKKNSITPLIKANGINYETLDTGISQTREGTDLIENRRFQVEEISRIFGVPKQMLDGTAGWSQEIFISFVQNQVKPIAEEMAARFTKLLPLRERKNHRWEWDYSSLERTNTVQLMTTIKDKLNNGLTTINEVREELNLPLFNDSLADEPMVAAGKLPLSFLLQKLKQEQAQEKQSQQQAQQTNNLMLGRPVGGTNGSNSAQYHQENPGVNDSIGA